VFLVVGALTNVIMDSLDWSYQSGAISMVCHQNIG